MAKYFLTNKAVIDLSDIWNYTFNKWPEKQADKYYKMLLDTCQFVANKPNIGKNYDAVFNGLIGHQTGHHIIFYSITRENEILIKRILHEQMD